MNPRAVSKSIVDFGTPLWFWIGLDSFNAFNVVESLVSLARDYNRTVIFTIHQPRSNIVALFDQLTVLAAGKLVYSGAYAKCQEYFASIGYPCPAGFNIADYLSTMFFPAFVTYVLILFCSWSDYANHDGT